MQHAIPLGRRDSSVDDRAVQHAIKLGRRDSSVDAMAESSVPESQPPMPEGHDADAAAVAVRGELWSEAMQLKEARERATWHEKMSRSNIEQSEALQAFPCSHMIEPLLPP